MTSVTFGETCCFHIDPTIQTETTTNQILFIKYINIYKQTNVSGSWITVCIMDPSQGRASVVVLLSHAVSALPELSWSLRPETNANKRLLTWSLARWIWSLLLNWKCTACGSFAAISEADDIDSRVIDALTRGWHHSQQLLNFLPLGILFVLQRFFSLLALLAFLLKNQCDRAKLQRRLTHHGLGSQCPKKKWTRAIPNSLKASAFLP